MIKRFFDFSTSSIPDFLQKSHYSSLDGFRAISIIAVVYCHICFNEENVIVKYFSGDWGVHFFFVISGFLITTLLLREKVRKGTIGLKKFYIRRVLRIFPVAYLYLLVILVLSIVFGVIIGWKSFASSLFYVRNLPFLNNGDWYTGHFWSLSVEEQFYLFVPWLLRKKVKLYFILSCILLLATPIISFFSFHGFSENIVVAFMDRIVVAQAPIIIGSLVAILLFYQKITVPKLSGLFSVILLLLSLVVKSNVVAFIPSVFAPIISSLLLVTIIASSIQHENGWYYRLLNNWLIVKIGILSYSIYVWQQLFTHYQMWCKFESFWCSILFNLLLLSVVSIVSYYFYERWFLKLKERFA